MKPNMTKRKVFPYRFSIFRPFCKKVNLSILKSKLAVGKVPTNRPQMAHYKQTHMSTWYIYMLLFGRLASAFVLRKCHILAKLKLLRRIIYF